MLSGLRYIDIHVRTCMNCDVANILQYTDLGLHGISSVVLQEHMCYCEIYAKSKNTQTYMFWFAMYGNNKEFS